MDFNPPTAIPILCISDGRFPVPGLKMACKNIIKGDQKSYSIACGAIIAKVLRDSMMTEYEKKYPGYGFDQHKGYCTQKHIDSLKTMGVLPIHRRSYKPVRDLLKGEEREQLSLTEEGE